MQLLTLKQVADLLKVHPNTVRAHAIRGTIPAAKVGRDWRFVEEDLIAWVRSRYAEGQRNATNGGVAGGAMESLRPSEIAAADMQSRTERALDALLAKPIRKDSQRRQ